MTRQIVVHLNISADDADERTADEIAECFLAHSDAETLIESITLAEEV